MPDFIQQSDIDTWLELFGYAASDIPKLCEMYGVNDPEDTDQLHKALTMTRRCGNPDNQQLSESATLLNKWAQEKQNNLTYVVVRYVNGIDPEVQEEIIANAWQLWEQACNLSLTRILNSEVQDADIVISASANRREEFGTVGNVLAWCELPQGPNHRQQLLCKLDLAERWLVSTGQSQGQGVYLLNVLTHEFGHGLGLSHTQIKGELMFPIYASQVFAPQKNYDVPEVQKRYGKPKPPTEPIPTPPPIDSLASRIKVKIDSKEYSLTQP